MSKKERMEGKLNELWTKWDDVDIDDIPEEELEKIGEELENLMGQIGYGTKSIFVHTQMEKYYQVIKLQDGFLFHFVGKKDIVRPNCIHTDKYIDNLVKEFSDKINVANKYVQQVEKKANAGTSNSKVSEGEAKSNNARGIAGSDIA